MIRYPLGLDMGEGAYQAMCDEVAFESDVSPPSLSEHRGWWRTRDGRVLRISQMEDRHVESAIALFEQAVRSFHAPWGVGRGTGHDRASWVP